MYNPIADVSGAGNISAAGPATTECYVGFGHDPPLSGRLRPVNEVATIRPGNSGSFVVETFPPPELGGPEHPLALADLNLCCRAHVAIMPFGCELLRPAPCGSQPGCVQCRCCPQSAHNRLRRCASHRRDHERQVPGCSRPLMRGLSSYRRRRLEPRVAARRSSPCPKQHERVLNSCCIPPGVGDRNFCHQFLVGSTSGNHPKTVIRSAPHTHSKPPQNERLWHGWGAGSAHLPITSYFACSAIASAICSTSSGGRSWPMPSISSSLAPLIACAVSRPPSTGTSGSCTP